MKNKINKLFLNAGLEKIETVEELKHGKWGNKFLVNKQYIVKLNSKAEDIFEKEIFVLNRFQNLPVPKLVKYDNSRKLIPEEYIIERKIKGLNLSSLWLQINKKQKESIFKQLILILKTFHKIKFDFYGDIVSNNKFKNWSGFLDLRYNTNKELAKKVNVLSKHEFELIDNFYKENKKYLDKPRIPPCFCHCDIHFNNILANNGNVSGILDFDLSCAAPFDYEFDLPICFFRQPSFWEYKKPLVNCEVWLKKYYPAVYKIPHIKERLGIYSIASDMKMLWLCKPFGYGDDVKKVIKKRILTTIKNGFKL